MNRLGPNAARETHMSPTHEQGGVMADPAPKSRMQALRNQTDDVIVTMRENIKRIFVREENLADLLSKSKEMEEAANQFNQTSQKVTCSFCWKNVKLIIVIVVIVLIIVLIIVLLATGVIPVSAPVLSTVAPTAKP